MFQVLQMTERIPQEHYCDNNLFHKIKPEEVPSHGGEIDEFNRDHGKRDKPGAEHDQQVLVDIAGRKDKDDTQGDRHRGDAVHLKGPARMRMADEAVEAIKVDQGPKSSERVVGAVESEQPADESLHDDSTMSLPFMSRCPAPQGTLQRNSKLPVLSATNSTISGPIPGTRGPTSMSKSRSPNPCVPSRELKRSLTRSPFLTRTSVGSH